MRNGAPRSFTELLGYEVQTTPTDPSSEGGAQASAWSHVQTVFSVQRIHVRRA